MPGTLMERVFGDGEIRVNSMHHMAIDELAPGLMVSAHSPDGVIEAFESKMDDWWIHRHAVPSRGPTAPRHSTCAFLKNGSSASPAK